MAPAPEETVSTNITHSSGNKRILVTPDQKIVLQQFIGQGGAGRVYQGIYRKTLRPCAVKVCKDFNVRNEVELLRKLRHPHIVQLEDAQKRGPVTFVVMELCQGGELFNLVIDQGRLDTQAAQKYFCQIASAVHYAHGLGIAHRLV